MGGIFMRVFKNATVMLLAVMLLSGIGLSSIAYAQEQDVQQQYQLLREFLDTAMNPAARMDSNNALDNVFKGIMGTPMQPLRLFDGEFTDWFIIAIENEDDLFNEELKDTISLATGIPSDRIGFFWLDTENARRREPQQVRITFEHMLIHNTGAMLEIMKNRPESLLHWYAHEEISQALESELVQNELAKRGVTVTIDETISVERTVNDVQSRALPYDASLVRQAGVSLRAGDTILIHRVPFAHGEVYTVGHPANASNAFRFFTASHGRWPAGSDVWHFDSRTHQVGAHRLSSPFLTPAGWNITNFRGSVLPGARTSVHSFGPISGGLFQGEIVCFAGTAAQVDGFRLANMNIADFGSPHFHMVGSDSGTGLFDRGTALGVHTFAVPGTNNGRPTWFHAYTRPHLYN